MLEGKKGGFLGPPFKKKDFIEAKNLN